MRSIARHRVTLAATAALALVLGSSCVIEPMHHWGEGVLTVRWSVEGGFDPHACAAHGAADADLVIYDDAGGFYDEARVPCGAFATSISLPGGWYSATLDLVDFGGHPVSTAVELGSFRLHDGGDVLLDADFPFWSFY